MLELDSVLNLLNIKFFECFTTENGNGECDVCNNMQDNRQMINKSAGITSTFKENETLLFRN